MASWQSWVRHFATGATVSFVTLMCVTLASAEPVPSMERAVPVLGAAKLRSLTAGERAALTASLRRLAATRVLAQHTRATRLRTPGAHALRLASRERYRRLGPGQALGLARSLFASSLFARPYNAGLPKPGVRAVRALDSNTELVASTQTGRRALMISSVPIETPNATGGQSPVNLAITDAGANYKPTSPLVPITIGKHLADGVTFTNGSFGFALQASGSDTPTPTASGVFFPNVGGSASASDFVVNPAPGGAEAFIQIRAASSPDHYVLRFTLPAGATLQHAQSANPIPGDPPTAIAIMRGGKALGYIYQPDAFDADGTQVQATAAISGNDVVLTVEHRGRDLHYPVLLDPIVAALGSPGYWNGWQWTQSDSFYNTNPPGCTGGNCLWSFGKGVDDPSYWPGLYTSMPTANWFKSGDAGLFYYPAPTGTYIGGAAFIGGHNAITTPYPPGGFSNYFIGLAHSSTWAPNVSNYNGSIWQAGNPAGFGSGLPSNTLLASCAPNCDSGPGANASTLAYVGIQAYASGGYVYTGGARDTVTASNSTVYLGDVNAPAIAGSPVSLPTWTNDHGQVYVSQPQLSDTGLGVQSASIVGTGGGITTAPPSSCGDYYRQPCPGGGGPGGTSLFSPQFIYSMPEGISHPYFTATDPTGLTSSTLATAPTVMIDRTAPTISLSGDLWVAANRTESGDPDPANFAIDQSDWPLHVAATDGVADGNPADARSGVKSIDVYVDGAQTDPAQHAQQTCPQASCGLSLDWTLHGSSLASGDHAIRVVAVDQAGNQSETDWTVTAQPSTGATPPPAPNSVVFDYRAGDPAPLDTSGMPVATAASVRAQLPAGVRPAPAWYVPTSSVKAARLAGERAGATGMSGVAILDFGQPVATTNLNEIGGPRITLNRAEKMALAFAEGYYYNLPTRLQQDHALNVAIGTNNCSSASSSDTMSCPHNGTENITRGAGAALGAAVHQLALDLAHYHIGMNVAASGAFDAEPAFGSASSARAYADGFDSAFANGAFPALFDFGSADGCPLFHSHNTPRGSCSNGWTQADLANLTFGYGRVGLPEIYYKTAGQEQQWQRILLYAKHRGGGLLYGPTNQYEVEPQARDYMPAESFAALKSALSTNPLTKANGLGLITDVVNPTTFGPTFNGAG